MYISTIKNINFDNLQKELNSNRLVFVTFSTSRLTVFPITLILFRICCRNQVGGNKLVNDHLIFSEKWTKNIANLLLSFWFISKHRFVKSPQKTWFGIFFTAQVKRKNVILLYQKAIYLPWLQNVRKRKVCWSYDENVNWMLSERFDFVPYAIFSYTMHRHTI